MKPLFIIGSGSIARRHAQNLREISPSARIYIYSKSKHGSILAEDVGGEVVPSIEVGLSHRPALCVIASGSTEHLISILAAIEAGVPFYLEKPVVTTRSELRSLEKYIAGCRKLPPSLVGCNLRFLPSLEKVKSLIDSGRIGKIARANFQAGQWLPDWRPGRDYKSGYSANADQGGGVALDLVHEIDAVRWMLGDFENVQATSFNTNILGIRSNDVAGALLSRGAGPLVFVGLDYIARKAHREYRFIGEKGTLTWNLQDRKITLDFAEDSEIIETNPAMFDIGATYFSAMRELISASSTGQTRYPLEEALRTTDLMLRIHSPHPLET